MDIMDHNNNKLLNINIYENYGEKSQTYKAMVEKMYEDCEKRSNLLYVYEMDEKEEHDIYEGKYNVEEMNKELVEKISNEDNSQSSMYENAYDYDYDYVLDDNTELDYNIYDNDSDSEKLGDMTGEEEENITEMEDEMDNNENKKLEELYAEYKMEFQYIKNLENNLYDGYKNESQSLKDTNNELYDEYKDKFKSWRVYKKKKMMYEKVMNKKYKDDSQLIKKLDDIDESERLGNLYGEEDYGEEDYVEECNYIKSIQRFLENKLDDKYKSNLKWIKDKKKNLYEEKCKSLKEIEKNVYEEQCKFKDLKDSYLFEEMYWINDIDINNLYQEKVKFIKNFKEEMYKDLDIDKESYKN